MKTSVLIAFAVHTIQGRVSTGCEKYERKYWCPVKFWALPIIFIKKQNRLHRDECFICDAACWYVCAVFNMNLSTIERGDMDFTS